jgi:hypothetical protein
MCKKLTNALTSQASIMWHAFILYEAEVPKAVAYGQNSFLIMY